MPDPWRGGLVGVRIAAIDIVGVSGFAWPEEDTVKQLATTLFVAVLAACAWSGAALGQDENSENGGGSGSGGGWNFDTPAKTGTEEVDPENLPVCAEGQTEGCLPKCEDGQTSNCIKIGFPDVTELQEQGAECGLNGGARGECSLR